MVDTSSDAVAESTVEVHRVIVALRGDELPPTFSGTESRALRVAELIDELVRSVRAMLNVANKDFPGAPSTSVPSTE